MYIHHSVEEKKEIIRLHELGTSMCELMKRYHVRDHYLYIPFGRYEKYGIDGLEKLKDRCITNTQGRISILLTCWNISGSNYILVLHD